MLTALIGFLVLAEVLVDVDIRWDVVEDELDDEKDWVLFWPVKLLIVPYIPDVLRIHGIKVEWFINEANLIYELAWCRELEQELVW